MSGPMPRRGYPPQKPSIAELETEIERLRAIPGDVRAITKDAFAGRPSYFASGAFECLDEIEARMNGDYPTDEQLATLKAKAQEIRDRELAEDLAARAIFEGR